MAETTYWTRALQHPVSRRGVLRGAAVGGMGLAGAALIGCGSDDDGGDGGGDGPPASSATETGATATATEAVSTGPKSGGTWRVNIALDPTSLDPYGNLSYTTKGFAAYVYSRLFRIDSQPEANPYDQLPTEDIAESAESTDGQHWTVKLRQGVKFHDKDPVNGRELTTEDVMFSWGRLTAPESPGANLVPAGMQVEAVDDYTLQFSLAEPSPTFLEFLADANVLWVMPTESDGGYDPIANPIGSGPWMMDEYAASSKLAFVKHPEFHVEGVPYMDGVELAIIPEYANFKAQFEAGNQHSFGVRTTDVLSLRDQLPDTQWIGELTAGLYFLFFSPEDMDPNAPWRDERFRQAVSMAMDRDGLLDLQYSVKELSEAGLDVSTLWNNVIPAGHGERFWLDPKSAGQGPSAAFFEYNPDEAAKLVAAVGGADQPFKYQYTGNGYSSTWVTYAEAAGNWLTDIGLKPETETQDYSSVYITNTFRGNFNGVAFGIETPFPEPGSWIERMFGEDPANHGRINDPTITDLHGQQRVEMDPEQRSELFHQIQVRHAEMMYYVPTTGGGGTSWTAYQPEVRGMRRTRGYGGPTENTPYYWLDV
ncbi:MAG: hypothetical protein GEU80_08570 [Dehalococcoidia bacterium]|nr:hypothetical protein [Dehalococcoidia bacterium]